MKVDDQIKDDEGTAGTPCGADDLRPLLGKTTSLGIDLKAEVVIGELIGLSHEGKTPLVVYPGREGTAAIAARSVLDLHGAQLGKQVVLAFDNGDRTKPIIIGVLREDGSWTSEEQWQQVAVEADGERLVVSAKEQLVLQCGKASITLTRDGKVLIRGAYLSTHSSGVNRIRGGSVQIN